MYSSKIAIGQHVDFGERRLVFEVRVSVRRPSMPRNLKAAMPRLPETSSSHLRHCLLQFVDSEPTPARNTFAL